MSGVPAPPGGRPDRWLILASWVVVVAGLALIPLRVISYGFVPAGDARRHVAKAYTARTYADIVTMRPEYTMDHSPGWEWLLRVAQRATGCGPAALAGLAAALPTLALLLAPLPWLRRRPEAWTLAVLALVVGAPEFPWRLTQGRPYLLTEALLVAILMAWSRVHRDKGLAATSATGKWAAPPWPRLALTAAAFAASTWVHGAWYLWGLVPVAFTLAGRRREALWLTACAAVGIPLGACLTWHPVAFLSQALDIAALIQRESIPETLLAGEFQPADGAFPLLTAMALAWAWQRWTTAARKAGSPERPGSSPIGAEPKAPPLHDPAPALALFALSWLLGLQAARFLADWGIPAALAWMAMQVEPALGRDLPGSARRLVGSAFLAAALYLHFTADRGGRYTAIHRQNFIRADDPALAGWLPEPGGRFLCAQFDFFFDTLYSNPTAPWRYALGMEPALMPEEDRRTFRRIQATNYNPLAYRPWIERMSKADRLVMVGTESPPLADLEWMRATGTLWLGRLPRTEQAKGRRPAGPSTPLAPVVPPAPLFSH